MPRNKDIEKSTCKLVPARLSSARQQSSTMQEHRHAVSLKEEGIEVVLLNSKPCNHHDR